MSSTPSRPTAGPGSSCYRSVQRRRRATATRRRAPAASSTLPAASLSQARGTHTHSKAAPEHRGRPSDRLPACTHIAESAMQSCTAEFKELCPAVVIHGCLCVGVGEIRARRMQATFWTTSTLFRPRVCWLGQTLPSSLRGFRPDISIAIMNAHSYTQEYEHAHTHTHTFLGRTRNHARPHARKPALGKTKAPADIAGNNGVPNTRFRRRSSTGTRWSSPRAAGTSLCRSRSAPAAFRARWMSGARAAEPRQRHFAAQRRHQCRAARKMGALRWRCGTSRWSAVAARRSTRRSASTGWRW